MPGTEPTAFQSWDDCSWRPRHCGVSPHPDVKLTEVFDKWRRIAPTVRRPVTVSLEQHTDDLGARHVWTAPGARIVGGDAIITEQQVVALWHVEGAPKGRVDGVRLSDRAPVNPQLAALET